MNVFYLDKHPRLAAEYQCDKHVVKMVLETAQLLSTAHRVLGVVDRRADAFLYKATHINHPCSIWVRSEPDQYRWTFDHFCFLLQEYYYRYGKIHKCDELRFHLINTPDNINWDASWKDPPLCMPDECKIEGDPVESYRNYYRMKKYSFATWKRREVPEWFNINKNEGTP